MNIQPVNASIITIGDELLIGQVIDTNSAWMAQQLNAIGVWVNRRVAVGDNRTAIWDALNEESRHADIILITGGLGPTADDITKPLLNEYFGGTMITNEEALQNVQNIFSKYLNRPLLPANLKQAEVPDVCTVIQNTRGTAPGMWFEKDGKVFVSMPGVPVEMKGMMTDWVLPQLPTMFKLPVVLHRTLLTAGIGESFLAERIKHFETDLPAYIKLAYLPNFGMVRLRLTGVGTDNNLLNDTLDDLFTRLQQLLPDVIVANSDMSIQQAVGNLLKENGATLATAESCTGGYIAHLITEIPGSSAYFLGTVVSYANSIKEHMLSVQTATLQQWGAVSEQTVVEMAAGVKKHITATYAIAVSGIMGPDGGSKEKPVGTVWMAVSTPEKVFTKKLSLRFDRKRNIELTANSALVFLYQAITCRIEQ